MSPSRLPRALLAFPGPRNPHGVLTLALLVVAATGACGESKPSIDSALVAAAPNIDWNLLANGFNESRAQERDELLSAGPVRIDGYLVPLEEVQFGEAQVQQTEFLLVPYMGACIHYPPPPPDQMIHVQMAAGLAASVDLWSWDPLEVTGVLKEEPLDSVYGAVGYRMDGLAVREFGSDWEGY